MLYKRLVKMRMKGTKAEGQVVIGDTFEGKVIKLKDVVLWGGIVIAFSNVIVMSVVDVPKELAEGDRLFIIIVSEGERLESLNRCQDRVHSHAKRVALVPLK